MRITVLVMLKWIVFRDKIEITNRNKNTYHSIGRLSIVGNHVVLGGINPTYETTGGTKRIANT
jgi:hypothetical protein